MSSLKNIDITAPGIKNNLGSAHIISKTIRKIEDIFTRFGFEIVSGPEVDLEKYNFDAVNVPKNHPARDMQDTFWIKGIPETVLRTHTSNTQGRYMLKNKLPIRVIVPGRVFRNEATDATHEAQFHQIEGLLIAENVSMANLKAILLEFLREFFEKKVNIRIRPGYFPFVEPGIEVDISCFKCLNEEIENCSVCKGSKWLEILGAGMIHPKVLEFGKIDSKKYQGFAFGMGVERMVMLKYGIDDIRDFYDGQIPFIKQFK